MERFEAHVVWSDGIADTGRECLICFSNTCVNPVHKDQYLVRIDSVARKWDEENPVV